MESLISLTPSQGRHKTEKSKTWGGSTCLFVPGNRSHVATQLPVAEELMRRGWKATFLVRDAVIHSQYHTKMHISPNGVQVCEYRGFYETDIGRRCPRLSSYRRSRHEIFRFLEGLEYDVVVTCNDDSALFDRLVVEHARRRGRELLLIQESVRPAQRHLPLTIWLAEQGGRAIAGPLARWTGRWLTASAFARRGYGHSECTMIAAAGERFRRQLMAQGVPPHKIRVTGQPRLDRWQFHTGSKREEPALARARVLLFCNQPLPLRHLHLDRLFQDLARACAAAGDVRLLLKLHPRDTPVEHWRRLVPSGTENTILDVTKNGSLAECLEMADGMITVASTTSLEAMAANVPVALVNFLPTSWYLPYAEYGAALSVDSPGELEGCIRKLLFDETIRSTLRANSQRVLADELYLRDGHSACRIADFIEERMHAKQ